LDRSDKDRQVVRVAGISKDTTQRELAEWVFGVGGKISIAGPKAKKNAVGIGRVEDLPTDFTISSLNLGGVKAIDDAQLARMADWPMPTQLQFHGTAIMDAGLAQLRHWPQLRALYLSENDITDAGLTQLKTLTRLNNLRLAKTKITDAGLIELETLKSLTTLHLQGTKVTAAGIAKLQKALPNCTIEWDGASK
jgi:Leucine-rich repeat (LRR) protein